MFFLCETHSTESVLTILHHYIFPTPLFHSLDLSDSVLL
uniref:Uncharacterized protein n=1 Tax=Anguilla anguilla TaxID=7936 RepID=A0A0E9Q419_ANGAN